MITNNFASKFQHHILITTKHSKCHAYALYILRYSTLLIPYTHTTLYLVYLWFYIIWTDIRCVILSITRKPISQCNCLNCKTFSLTTDTSPISWVTLVIKNCYDMSVHNFAVPSFAAVAQSSKISK